MTNIITILLAVAVAVLALLCCMLFHAVGRKDDRLTKLEDERHRLQGEIHRLHDVIEDKDDQLMDNDKLIHDLFSKLRDGGGGSD